MDYSYKTAKIALTSSLMLGALSCLHTQPAHAFIFGFGGGSYDAGQQQVSFTSDIDPSAIETLAQGSYLSAIKDFQVTLGGPELAPNEIPIFSEGITADLEVEGCPLPASIATCLPGFNEALAFNGSVEEEADFTEALLEQKYVISFSGQSSDALEEELKTGNVFTDPDSGSDPFRPLPPGFNVGTDSFNISGKLGIVISKQAPNTLSSLGFIEYDSPINSEDEILSKIIAFEEEIGFSDINLPEEGKPGNGKEVPEPSAALAFLLTGVAFGLRQSVNAKPRFNQ